ncbi:hypothetical protein ACG7TL_004193 [Trametes sanguinea]
MGPSDASYIPLLTSSPDNDQTIDDIALKVSTTASTSGQTGEPDSRLRLFVLVACSLTVFSAAVNVLVVSFNVLSQRLGEASRSSQAGLKYANTYIGLDSAYRNPAATPPSAIRSFPFTVGMVNRSLPGAVFLDTPRFESTFGTVYPEDRRIRLSPTESTFVQLWAGDYGMERCSLEMTIPFGSSSSRFSDTSSGVMSSIQVWRVDAPRKLDLRFLSWNSRPNRLELVASWSLYPNNTVASPEFFCPSGSFQTFELGCLGSGCLVDFRQTPKQKDIGFYTLFAVDVKMANRGRFLCSYVFRSSHPEYQKLILRLVQVVYIWIMDTVHQILTNRGFWVLISRVHDPFILSREYLWAGLFTSLVTLPTQLFFTLRIWRLSKNHWLVPLIFVPCTLFQFAGYIAFLVICLRGGPTAEIIFVIQKLPMAFWGVGAAEDILISLTLIFLLWHNRNPGGFRSTDRLIYRLTVFAINTGVWTALCALFTIITLAAYPNIQIYVSLNLVICPLYCNTLLANLNARGYIRGDDFTEPNRSSTSRTARSHPGRNVIAFAPFRSTTTESSHPSSHTEVHELSMPTFANNSSLKLQESTLGATV